MGRYGVGPGGVGWVMMTVTMMALWALLLLGGIAVYRSLQRGPEGTRRQVGDAERLLDERFARGEIDVDEYTNRRNVLRDGS